MTKDEMSEEDRSILETASDVATVILNFMEADGDREVLISVLKHAASFSGWRDGPSAEQVWSILWDRIVIQLDDHWPKCESCDHPLNSMGHQVKCIDRGPSRLDDGHPPNVAIMRNFMLWIANHPDEELEKHVPDLIRAIVMVSEIPESVGYDTRSIMIHFHEKFIEKARGKRDREMKRRSR